MKRYPLKKRANRPPFKVRLIPTILYHYIHIFASIISTVKFNEIFLIMGGGFLGPFQTMLTTVFAVLYMNLEKYALRHYRKHTVKQRESDILKGKKHRCDNLCSRRSRKRHLPWAWTASGHSVGSVRYVPAEGLKYSVSIIINPQVIPYCTYNWKSQI